MPSYPRKNSFAAAVSEGRTEEAFLAPYWRWPQRASKRSIRPRAKCSARPPCSGRTFRLAGVRGTLRRRRRRSRIGWVSFAELLRRELIGRRSAGNFAENDEFTFRHDLVREAKRTRCSRTRIGRRAIGWPVRGWSDTMRPNRAFSRSTFSAVVIGPKRWSIFGARRSRPSVETTSLARWQYAERAIESWCDR